MGAENRKQEARAAGVSDIHGLIFTCWAADLETTILMISKDPARAVRPGTHAGHVVGVNASFVVTSVSPNQAFVTAITRTPLGAFMDEEGVLRANRDVVIYPLRGSGE